MPSHLATDRTYITSLEGWRGIVSVFVMLFHFYMFFAPEPFLPFAFLGVDFFFIISGFIIARQYEASIGTHATNFRTFAIRRLARLYPIYILSIALFVWVNHMYIEPSNHKGLMIDPGVGARFTWQMVLQLTMLGNLGGMVMPWNGPAWSVSVEWIVNLLFFLMAWNLRRIPTLVWLGLAAFSAVYLTDVSPKSLNLIFAWPPFFNATIARGLLGFSIGALIFRFHQSLPRLSWTALHLLDILLVLAVFTVLGYYRSDFVIGLDYVFVLVLFPPLIIISLYKHSWIGRAAGLPPFTFLGRISYSIYLLHLPIAYAYQYSPTISGLQLQLPYYGLFYMLITIAISTLAYLFIETPCRAIGRQLTKPPAPAAPIVN